MDVVQQLADLPYADALELHAGPITSEELYDAAHFSEVEFDDSEAGGARFIECAFTSVTLAGGRFRRARFNEVWMQAVRMVGTDLAESDWLDSALMSVAVSGAEAYSSELRRVRFAGCKLDSVNFRDAELHDVEFADCTLAGVDFGGARLTGVRFPGSALRDVRLDNATLKKVDLRGVTELELASGYGGLSGAIISNAQLIQVAPALARELKITVKER